MWTELRHAVPTVVLVPPPDAPDARKEQEEADEKGDDEIWLYA
jgi:hypothetical protein